MKSKTSPTPTRKKHEAVDERLLSTAGRCFIEDGFGFGIDDILAQSGVAKMSLYTKFGSKYGLMERLLVDSAQEWGAEIDQVAADMSLQGPEKITNLVQRLCSLSRDLERRTGLLGQALVEFPLTGKQDEMHRKKDQVHEKARALQGELLKSLKALCGDIGVVDPLLLAQQVLLLVNGYLIMEPLLGETRAVKLTTQTVQTLLGQAPYAEPSAKPVGRALDVLEEKNLPAVRRTSPPTQPIIVDEDFTAEQKVRINRKSK